MELFDAYIFCLVWSSISCFKDDVILPLVHTGYLQLILQH